MSILSGLNIVITGASGNLGSTVTRRLRALGAHCFVPIIESEVPAHLKDEGISVTTKVDLTDESSVDAFFGKLPPLAATVNIAGGFAFAPITETTADLATKMFRINTLSCLLSCRASIDNMRKAGKGGHIVNISARPALRPEQGANMSAYAASKAAVAALTGALAEEVKADGISLNALCPSIIDTPENRRAMPDADPSNWVTPDEIANEIVHLVSRASAVVSGALIPIYGKA